MKEFDKDDDSLRVVTSERSIPADIVILVVCVRPNSETAKKSGLGLGGGGGIVVDEYVHASEIFNIRGQNRRIDSRKELNSLSFK